MNTNDSSTAASDDYDPDYDALECSQPVRFGTLDELLGTSDDEIEFDPERLGLTARTPEL